MQSYTQMHECGDSCCSHWCRVLCATSGAVRRFTCARKHTGTYHHQCRISLCSVYQYLGEMVYECKRAKNLVDVPRGSNCSRCVTLSKDLKLPVGSSVSAIRDIERYIAASQLTPGIIADPKQQWSTVRLMPTPLIPSEEKLSTRGSGRAVPGPFRIRSQLSSDTIVDP
jgi:hypothetical protein